MNSDKSFASLRIAFGVVWVIDAYFKWLPAFFMEFYSYFTSASANQPFLEQIWVGWWTALVSHGTFWWALATAIIQTLIAIGLLFGIGTRTTIVAGIIMSLLIWTIPEGLGGPYISGATDIGAAIIYVFVFVALWIGKSWRAYSIDAILATQKHKNVLNSESEV